MELCGGELADLSQLELLKRDDLKFQVLDDEDYSDDISNELSELDNFDDDDEDYYWMFNTVCHSSFPLYQEK